MGSHPGRAVTWAMVATLLLLAAYVRLSHPELSWFSVDQARDAQAARDIVTGRAFPPIGVALSGAEAHTWGPAYFYLIAIPFAVSRDPAVAVAFLSALTVVSVLLTYRFALRFFGRPAAVLSVAMVGTYPLAVIESNALWNVAPLPLFAVVFFHGLFSLVVHGRSVMIVPALAALGILVQLHLSALSLAGVLALGIALFRPSIRARHLVLGAGLLLALLLPYGLAQWRSGFADLRFAASWSSAQVHLRGPLELAEVASRVLFASPDVVSGLAATQAMWRPDVFLGLHRLQAWALVVGLAAVGLGAVWSCVWRRGAESRALVLISLGFAIPLVTLGARWDVRPHYFDVTYPMPFIAAALSVSRVVDAVGRIAGAPLRRVLWSGLALIVAATVLTQVDFHRQLWRRIGTTGAIVWAPAALELMPIRYKAELSRILAQEFRLDAGDVASRVHGSRARDLSEDKGYFFEWKAAAGASGSTPAPDPASHYVIVRDETAEPPGQATRIARAGPYVVAAYRPLIDYSSWQCADDPSGDRGRPDAWAAVRIPMVQPSAPATYGLAPSRSWRSPVVTCRGAVSVSGPPRPLLIVVSLRSTVHGDRGVEALHLNGVPVVASRVRAHSTFAGDSMDVVFDVGAHLRPGANALTMRVFSRPPRFDLDVYELRG